MKLLTYMLCLFLAVSVSKSTDAQRRRQVKDTLKFTAMDSVLLQSYRGGYVTHMPDVLGVNIYAGKRTNRVVLAGEEPVLARNLGRTAFARIPGLTMWEMDGAGTQMNIGTRGTDPHRSIEMNMRQNGYNTNSDVFGYPENHYTVPLQAVEEVQLVRGSAALQFGPQFGGMLNYRIKTGDTTRPAVVETEQTAGSNNLFNSYNALGGTSGKWNYYAFYDYRHTDGWRANAKMTYHSWYVHASYTFNKKLQLQAEFSRMNYQQQIAGGLTDEQFRENPRQSFRERNYFRPIINIPAIRLQYTISPKTTLSFTANGLFGERSSVQFINAGNIPDTFNTNIGSFNPRQVDRDFYNSYAAELRVLHTYQLGSLPGIVSGGIHAYSGNTRRRQKGVGTTGSDPDFDLTSPYGTDLQLKTRNLAFFAENNLHFGPAFSLTPGVRLEVIKTHMTGLIDHASVPVAYNSQRVFPLFGLGAAFQLAPEMEFYANVTQAYRPYLYANITPADRLDRVDPSLKDSKGSSTDFGFRGRYRNLLWFDVDAFYLYYGDKIGLVAATETNGTPYLLTTNTGNAVTKGVETFLQCSVWSLAGLTTSRNDIRVFNSLAYNDARYVSGNRQVNGANKSIKGNMVENAPAWEEKAGFQCIFGHFSCTGQYTYTGKSYNDAFNTEFSTNGVIGRIPAWHVWDFSCEWHFPGNWHLAAGINNLTNEQYFNRRITFYPGPGILPANGRTVFVSFGARI